MKKIIENAEDYEIYENGTVFSLKRRKFLKIGVNQKGYLMVDICIKGVKKKKLIHRLLAQAFIPNPFNKPQVNHINGIKIDNRIENLEWTTNSENQKHAYNSKLKIPTLNQIEAGRKNLTNWHKKKKLQ
jgi:hypothetical protein